MSCLLLSKSQWDRHHYSPHFSDKETDSLEASKSVVVRVHDFHPHHSDENWAVSALLLDFQSSTKFQKKTWPSFKERVSTWAVKVAYETDKALQVLWYFFCPHSHPSNPQYISNTLIVTQRHGFDYIGSEMPPGFQWNLSFFFQQQYVQFFFLFSLLHSEICQEQNIVPVESQAREPEKNVHIEWAGSLRTSICPLSSYSRDVKTISFCQSCEAGEKCLEQK